MFLLSKLLPLLLLPLGVALLLLLWGVLRSRRWPAIAALAVLWLFATPLIAEGLWRWLERPYVRQSTAAVLAGSKPRGDFHGVVVLGTGASPRERVVSMPIASLLALRPTSSCAARACARA